MNISVVIPLLNEQESLPELCKWIEKVMSTHNFSYEILFVDDGSTDASWETIQSLSKDNNAIKGIRFLRNYGKSQGLHAGFAKAQGDVVITMDADLQDSPDEIPDLYDMIMNQGYDLVSGWKKKRYDSVVAKNLPSKLFNWAARKISGVKLNDFNCGLKAYKNVVIKNIEVSGEMHRYIPVLAKNAGFSTIGEKIVIHQARKYGSSKFGMDRFVNGFLDLITIWFISKFGKRPMHFFGLLGTLMFIIGFGFALYLGVDKLFIHTKARLITERPQFYIALTSMIIGTQLFLAGFLGEIILRTKNNEERYKISEELGVGS
ncbi:glycosyltransferase family 2 protein [Flavobacterium sp. 20NA77.7]|uniref:Glycosyltransferase family 2 protein n=1 Tax=Flavobacterium nakdongensis TaxID=3073563 RepID=A0ABY9R8P9_9FLAO|nr:glycosyltransferase family 2 protein [Flavobacterium sp. 20NA77.7]WMW77134.1 glycosyltransferase family 2 protein [Flavobacterium sp. 20NA77.7]